MTVIPDPLTQDDLEACGIGLGEKTCCYIIADGQGFHCGKVEDALAGTLMLSGREKGLRVPVADYPNCQLDTCAECGGQIHVEHAQWYHTRIESDSHQARP